MTHLLQKLIVHYVVDDVPYKSLDYVADRGVCDVTDSRHDVDSVYGGGVRHDVSVVVMATLESAQHGVEDELDGRRDDVGGRGGALATSGDRVERHNAGEECHVPGEQLAAAGVAVPCRRRRGTARLRRRTFVKLI